MVLFILVILWAAVLLPPWVRKRREGRPSASITSFRRQLSTLERARPVWNGQQCFVRSGFYARGAARRRRRRIFVALLGVTALALGPAVLVGGASRLLFGAAALLFGCYTALLIRVQKRVGQRMAKVRYLTPRPVHAEPVVAMRRSASN